MPNFLRVRVLSNGKVVDMPEAAALERVQNNPKEYELVQLPKITVPQPQKKSAAVVGDKVEVVTVEVKK